MSVIDQIIDLNSVAMMGGAGLDRFYVTPAEFRRLFNSYIPRQSIREMKEIGLWRPGIKGFVDGVAIIVVEEAICI